MPTENEKRAEAFLNALGNGKSFWQMEEELQEAEEKANNHQLNESEEVKNEIE